jgi:hypothetical protein
MIEDIHKTLLRDLVKSAPKQAGCIDFHHTPADRHDHGEPCPVVQRYFTALAAAQQALAK